MGILCAIEIWLVAINNGFITNGIVYAFAFSIALSLSGILVLITRRSFSELSTAWEDMSGFVKFLITISICAFIYIGGLIIGDFVLRRWEMNSKWISIYINKGSRLVEHG